jgi:hypothetical protein
MTKGDVYRLRAKRMETRMKKATRTDKAVMAKKKKALEDMAGVEDWLDGKPGSQLKNKKA